MEMRPQVSPLSPEWPPSTDQLAQVVSDMHWRLEQLAYDLANRPHVTRGGSISDIADDMVALAQTLRRHEAACLSLYSQRTEPTEGSR